MLSAGCDHRSVPRAAPASARAATAMAFHSVSTLSSRPGRTRASRRAKSACRPRSTSGGRRNSIVKGTAQDVAAFPVARLGGAVPGHRSRPGYLEHLRSSQT